LSKLIIISMLIVSGLSALGAEKGYPIKWWKIVDKSTVKWWEVLPEQAKPGEVVLSKRNDLGILSNFAHTPFSFEGKKYQSIEGLWQSMKYPETKKDQRSSLKNTKWPHTREEVEQMVAFEAKKAGSVASKIMKSHDINWVTYKGRKMPYKIPKKGEHYKLIKKFMWAKVSQNPKVKKILLQTKNLNLIPDHKVKKDAPPAWKYNTIWMEIRSKLQKQ
jgi:predicted NAD-dependent protein-ADP-ribosyltransferase YbiA (DUF1768 family)